jgi:hypothetical protein
MAEKILTGEDPNCREEHLPICFLADASFSKVIGNPNKEIRPDITLTLSHAVASSTVAAQNMVPELICAQTKLTNENQGLIKPCCRATTMRGGAALPIAPIVIRDWYNLRAIKTDQ